MKRLKTWMFCHLSELILGGVALLGLIQSIRCLEAFIRGEWFTVLAVLLATPLLMGLYLIGCFCAVTLILKSPQLFEMSQQIARNTSDMKGAIDDLNRQFPGLQDELEKLSGLAEQVSLPNFLKKKTKPEGEA